MLNKKGPGLDYWGKFLSKPPEFLNILRSLYTYYTLVDIFYNFETMNIAGDASTCNVPSKWQSAMDS